MISRLSTLMLAIGLCLFGSGCSDLIDVKGIVTLDGVPVEGAVVMFVAENGTDSYSGLTDSNGEFSLVATGDKKGAKAGNYKVLVTKTSQKREAMAPPTPGGGKGSMNDTAKEMMNASKGGKSAVKSGGGMAPRAPGGGMMVPGGGTKPTGIKTELPVIYASLESTPITAKIPLESSPIKIELKSK